MSQTTTGHTLSTAEAFYRVFCALSLQERIAIAHYILADEQVQQMAQAGNAVPIQEALGGL